MASIEPTIAISPRFTPFLNPTVDHYSLTYQYHSFPIHTKLQDTSTSITWNTSYKQYNTTKRLWYSGHYHCQEYPFLRLRFLYNPNYNSLSTSLVIELKFRGSVVRGKLSVFYCLYFHRRDLILCLVKIQYENVADIIKFEFETLRNLT